MRTSLASWLVGISGAFVVLTLLFLDWRLVFLTIPPLVYLTIAGLYPVPKPALDVSREVSMDNITVGREVLVTLRVTNQGHRLDFLELFEEVPIEFEVTRGSPHIVLALDSGEEFVLTYAISPRLKGIYNLGPIFVRSMAPSGLEYEEIVIPLQTKITVAPQLEDIRRVKLQPRRTRLTMGQIPSRRTGLGTEFWGLREYHPGDELHNINWKASARFDRLISNEVEGEQSGDAVIVVDARYESLVGPIARSTIEYCVRASFAIASKILEGRNRVGLIVERGVLDWVYPGYGRKQLLRILDALIHVRPGGEWPLDHATWVLERFFPRNCQVILVSPILDESMISTVTELAARGFAITIVSPSSIEVEKAMYADDPTLEVAYRLLVMERGNIIAMLRRYADVIDWDPKQPLAVALRGVRPSPRPR